MATDTRQSSPWSGTAASLPAVPVPRIVAVRYGEGSIERFRLREFAVTFPTLALVAPASFLCETVAKGNSIRKAIPYWSSWFSAAARQPGISSREARARLMHAVLRTIGVPEEHIPTGDALDYLELCGLVHPFSRQPAWKEAFARFLFRELAHERRPVADFEPLFLFCSAKRYVCTRTTTFPALERRMRQRSVREVRGTAPFPLPWLPLEWSCNGFRIVYLQTPAELGRHARKQRNCAAEYGPDVAEDFTQIYALRTADGTTLGTIELCRDEKGDVCLGQCLGPGNVELRYEHVRAVNLWFRTAPPGPAVARTEPMSQ